jgi:hypothetical protein
MVATLQWQNSTGATESWSTITWLRFKAADDNTDDAVNPLVKPSTGTNYSFEKWLRINISVAPTTNVSNLNVLNSAASAPGVTESYGFTATYATPVGTNSSVATTTLAVSEISWSNAGTKTTTGAWGDLLVLQLDLSTSVSGGELGDWNTIAR